MLDCVKEPLILTHIHCWGSGWVNELAEEDWQVVMEVLSEAPDEAGQMGPPSSDPPLGSAEGGDDLFFVDTDMVGGNAAFAKLAQEMRGREVEVEKGE